MKDAPRRTSGHSGKPEMMRGEGNPAVKRIVFHDVSRDQVVARDSGVVAEQNGAGIVVHQVARNRGVSDSAQVHSFATVEPFASLEIGRQARTCRGWARVEALVVVSDVIIENAHERRISDEDALKVGISNAESGDHHMAQPRMMVTIDINAVS